LFERWDTPDNSRIFYLEACGRVYGTGERRIGNPDSADCATLEVMRCRSIVEKGGDVSKKSTE